MFLLCTDKTFYFFISFSKPLLYLKSRLIFDKAALKLCKAPVDANNLEGWLIFSDLLNEWVAKGVASDPHDSTVNAEKRIFSKFKKDQSLSSCFGVSELYTRTRTLDQI